MTAGGGHCNITSWDFCEYFIVCTTILKIKLIENIIIYVYNQK